MSVIGSSILAGASGAAGGEKVYVDDVFSTFLWQGDGGYNLSPPAATVPVNNGIDLAGEGGLVWLKNREVGYGHWLFDTERGGANSLASNTTGGQIDRTSSKRTLTFNSTGFVVGKDDLSGGLNIRDYPDNVSWSFRKAPGFFDVVTWNAASLPADNLVAHNLGSVPGMIICKNIDAGTEWQIYHRSATSSSSTDPNAHFLQFNTNPATYSSGMASASTGWAVSSTHFRAVGSLALDNGSDNFIAYIFAHDDAQFGTGGDESIIKCGSYPGTGSGGNRVELGFEPQFVMLKSATYSDAYTGWYMLDTMRGFNTTTSNAVLEANLSSSENPTSGAVKISGNGFELNAGGSEYNKNGETYIYMAIRRPNKPPEAATDVFALHSQTAPQNSWTPGFVPDSLIFNNYTTNNYNRFWGSRLQSGAKWLYTDTSGGEPGNSTVYIHWDDPTNTIRQTYYQGGSASWINYAFKRAPGFMDVVAYQGTGSAHTVSHNLDVTPELAIFKKRNAGYGWLITSSELSNWSNKFLMNNGQANLAEDIFTAVPTPTQLKLSTSSYVNLSSDTYIAYLFATLSDISKVGTYSGYTSNAVNVNCGFSAGARFILIKRIDADADWYVWDSARGIASGNDPYLLLNSSAAQVTNTDYIDPNVYGFTVTASAPAALNATGGTYLFLAIA